MGSELDSIVIALIASWLIQLGKVSSAKSLAWLSSHRPGILRAVAAIIAALSVAGISWTYSSGDLHVSGLTAANLGALLWAAIKQYAWQYGGFKLLFSKMEAK